MRAYQQLFPSDNDEGIPMLLPELQATCINLPVIQWGEVPRSSSRYIHGTIGFYVDDYRFSALDSEPLAPIMTGYTNAIEPNYSVGPDTPLVVAKWQTYRKRWMARFWQSYGCRVFVDLNVSPVYSEINMLGVPIGWQAYATRGSANRIDDLQHEYDIACNHAGCKPAYFVVYRGGIAVEQWCRDNAVVHVLDRLTAARRMTSNEQGKRVC